MCWRRVLGWVSCQPPTCGSTCQDPDVLLYNSTLTDEMAPQGDKRTSMINDDKRGVSMVELTKKEGSTLGLIIAGGTDKGCRPKIANLRPGSIAHRSDALAVGDYLVSVNGIRTVRLRHDEIVNLLKNAQEKVTLEVEYEIPPCWSEAPQYVVPKVIQIHLEKEQDGFGFTLRGGTYPDRSKSRPLTVTHVRPGGPADREGTLKAGDRLIAVDNVNLTTATLGEAQVVLRQVTEEALVTVEYDVGIVDAVRNAAGPVLVELDKMPGRPLGITLTTAPKDPSAIIIESVKQASLAERCGALHVNDQLLAIDGTNVEHMTPAEATQLLKTSIGEQIRLELLPLSQLYLKRIPETTVKKSLLPPPSPGPIHSPYSNFNTLSSCRSGAASRFGNSRKHLPKSIAACPSTASLSSNITNVLPPIGHVCHTETTEVTLHADHRGFGFAVQGSAYANDVNWSPPVIGNLDPGGPAETCGVMQVGDRLLAINGCNTEHATVEEITQMIMQSKPRVHLHLEFDVAESVVPSSGTFSVKLAKRGNAGLGITITTPKNRQPGDPLIISDVRRGSIAQRTGTLQPGDRLLAINAVRMDNCTIEDATHILQTCDDIVKLRIRKDELFSDDVDVEGVVVYSVELVRHGGPLGITISGTEDPFDPIIISGLTHGGLAERTGALHVGVRLLAINGHSLRGKPLSEAILLLQNSGDIVTLKVSKSAAASSCHEKLPIVTEHDDYMLGKHGTPLPSVDSAVESWDSTALEATHSKALAVRNNGESESDCQRASSSDKRLSEPHQSQSRERMDDGISDSEWDNRTHSSRGSGSYDCSAHLAEDKEWAEVLDEFEACNQQIREMDLASGNERDDGARSSASSSRDNAHSTQPLPSSGDRAHLDDGYLQSHRYLDGVVCAAETPYSPVPVELHRVTLFKDNVYEDFGFSVSDGLFERGVYINRIRPGGPADLSGILQPCDRILQVNGTKTHDFDCCLTVPLVASAGDKIEVVVARNPYASFPKLQGSNGALPWIEDDDQENCSSPVPPHVMASCITSTL